MGRVAGAVLLLAVLPFSARGDDLPLGAVARLGDPGFRAGSRVEQLALSPDGKQYATMRSGSEENVLVAVCDAATGRPLRETELNRELFGGLVWGPGGAHAITMRADAMTKDRPWRVYPDDFRVWDLADLRSEPPPVFPVPLHFYGGPLSATAAEWPDGRYTEYRFGAAGTRVAARWRHAGGTKHAIHLFELKPAPSAAKLTRCATIDLGAEGADEVLVSADGKTVLTFRGLAPADPDEREHQYAVTAWGLDGKPSARVQVRTAPGERPLLTPDGRGLVLFAAEDAGWGFDLFDLVTRKRRSLARWKGPPPTDSLEPGGRGGWAFSADGRLLVVAVDGKTLALDVEAGRELGRLEGHAGAPAAVAVSADGSVIGTADDYGLVRLWNAKELTPRGDAPGHRAPVRHAELSPDGKRLLTWAPDETVRLWDLATGKELRAFAGAVGLHGGGRVAYDWPTFTPDGTAAVYSTKDRLVQRDLLSGLEAPLPGGMKGLGPRFAAFAPDGRAVLTWAGPFGTAEVWDWPTGSKRFGLEKGVAGDAGFSTDGATVFLRAQWPERWDARTGKDLEPAWKDKDRKVYPLLSLRPNPRLLVDEAGLGVIDAGSGKPVTRFRLASGGLPPGAYLRTFWGVALSPAGGQFAAARNSDDPDDLGAALLYEAATCTVRRELKGHRGEVRVLGFTPDGSKLLTAGGDHTVLVWDVRLQAVPLPDALKKETDAAKLWNQLATGDAKDAYLAMARLSREPDAAVKMARLRLRLAGKPRPETDAEKVGDARAVELLDAVATADARALLKELADGHADAFRTQEARRALERSGGK